MCSVRVRYQTLEFGELDIHIRSLRDTQEFEDVDGVAEKLGISSASWPLFGIVWAAGEVLAHHMFDFEIEGKRILEVGCGLGLSSLLLNERLADITATDYHPEVGQYLSENVDLNNGRKIPFFRTAWEDADNGMGEFDLIIGSDVLYERSHVVLLSDFINLHAKEHCEVILIDPGRGHHAPFSKRMVTLGFSHRQHKPKETSYLEKPFPGQILSYSR